jgi:hypothetical protein
MRKEEIKLPHNLLPYNLHISTHQALRTLRTTEEATMRKEAPNEVIA